MDVARPFKAVFADPAWFKKMLIAAAINFVPFLGIALVGYLLEYQRNVAEGRDDQLPEWDRLGEYWVRGLQVMGAYLVYFLPLAVIFGFAIAIPIVAGLAGSEDVVGVAICGMFLVYALGMLLAIAVGIMSFALTTHFNVYRQFGAFFRVGEVWRIIRANAGAYFGALGMSWVVSMAMSMLVTPLSYGVSFAMIPMLDAMDSTSDFLPMVLGVIALEFVLVVLMIVLYTPAYHVMFHYLGQYMRRAYGFAPSAPAVPAPVAPAGMTAADSSGRDDDLLPPPPPPVSGPLG